MNLNYHKMTFSRVTKKSIMMMLNRYLNLWSKS